MTAKQYDEDEELEALAEQFSKDSHVKWLDNRDQALHDLYVAYGSEVTVNLTGWTKPTVLAAYERCKK